MLKSRKLSLLVIAVMFCTIWLGAGLPQAQAAVQPNDISGHWAQAQIQNMIGQGFIAGYPEGTFQPDNPITRAEFITIYNRAFKFTTGDTVSFSDVKTSDWFAPEIGKARAAGYIAGYTDGTMKPNNPISREEVATIITKINNLPQDAAAAGKFMDAASIAAWSKGSVGAVVTANLMAGYPDGTFKPASPITRAEAVATLSNALGSTTTTTYSTAGTYGPATGTITIAGNVMIQVPGVILQNTIIQGNLIIAETVDKGQVTLNNVTVEGQTIINGGDTTLNGKFNSVLMRENNGKLIIEGQVSALEVTSPTMNAHLDLNRSHINSVTVAAGTSGTQVHIANGMVIDNFYSYAPLDASGEGQVTTSYVYASGITSTLTPSTRIVAPGVFPPGNPNDKSSGHSSGSSGIFNRPGLTNVRVGNIVPDTTATADGYILTFDVDPATHYTTGTATLSERVNYRVQGMGQEFTGSATTHDDLVAMAFELMDLVSATPGDGALGSNLLVVSPVTLTLTAGGQQTTYTFEFI